MQTRWLKRGGGVGGVHRNALTQPGAARAYQSRAGTTVLQLVNTQEKVGKGFTGGTNGEVHNEVCASKLYLKKKSK